MINFFLNLFKVKTSFTLYRETTESYLSRNEFIPFGSNIRTIEVDRYIGEKYPNWVVISHDKPSIRKYFNVKNYIIT